MSSNLEKKTQLFVGDLAAKNAPPIYSLTPQQAREVLEDVQSDSSYTQKLDVEITDYTLASTNGNFSLRILRPKNCQDTLPILFYVHGAGWVMGSKQTHDRLVRELALGAHAAVVFIDYERSPEAQFPIAIEQSYSGLEYINTHAGELNLDINRLAIAGDSVGGNMAIALTILAQERSGLKVARQLLFYPVTQPELNTDSYSEFADGPWLTKRSMEWFWDAYAPDTSQREHPLIKPFNLSPDQLKSFPPTLLITAENDVLRDGGEAFAHELIRAGVDVVAVRFLGTMHDFVMLNALAETPATRGAINLANFYLKQALHNS